MSLTTDDLNILKGYFEPAQHEFLNDMAYIQERAITDRIELVDPSWSFIRAGDPIYTEGQVTIMMALTISGVTRTNAGTSDLLYKVKKENINGKWTAVDFQRDFDNIKVPANEAAKSATTDALKRCARLFGIGRYLLDMDGVKDATSLQRWLTAQKAKTLQFPTTPPPAPAPAPQSNGSLALNPQSAPKDPDWLPVAKHNLHNHFRMELDDKLLAKLDKQSWADFPDRTAWWLAICELAARENWALVAWRATYMPKDKGAGQIVFDTAVKTVWYKGRTELAKAIGDGSIRDWTAGEHGLKAPVLVLWTQMFNEDQQPTYKNVHKVEALEQTPEPF